MHSYFKRTGLSQLLLLMLISGCASLNQSLNSTLWVQTASEYRANSIQVFNNAAEKLKPLKSDLNITASLEKTTNYSSLPVAVVMDVDETVLDNPPYQAQLILSNATYNADTWDDWIKLQDADIVPGADEFIAKARAEDIKVIFITNRTCKAREESASRCPQETDTIANLSKVGITGVTLLMTFYLSQR